MSCLPIRQCICCPMDYESTQAHLPPPSPRRALSDITNQQSPRGGKRPGAGRPSSAERDDRFAAAAASKHQQDQQRRDMAQKHQSLANARGHSLSKGERRTVLAFLLALQAHDGKGLTEAINQVAKWLGSSDNTIRDVWRHYQEHHTVGEAAVHNRGGAAKFIEITIFTSLLIKGRLFSRLCMQLRRKGSIAHLANCERSSGTNIS